MAGGEATLIFNAWRYGGSDPFRLYNCLDAEYRRVWAPELSPVRPRHPERLRAFMYACGKAAAIIEGKMKDVRLPVAQRGGQSARSKRVILPDGVDDPRNRGVRSRA